ncbi:DUF58 domain-containing protein [Streptomyces sp. NPDC059118]|uniref:DUF58 domain-containing protein n=1 Tax=unclassified Streptomyces TaxID=2593676 RepID=UPI0036B66309
MLDWEPAPLLRRLTTSAVLALVLAAVLGRAELVLVAVPLLWWLASADRAGPTAGSATSALRPDRVEENGVVSVFLTVGFDHPVVVSSAGLRLPGGLHVEERPALPGRAADHVELAWQVRASRWGRWRIGPAVLLVLSTGGLSQARLVCEIGEVAVLPRPAPAQAAVRPADLPRHVGEHPASAPGTGLEFEGLRPYRPGDRPRQVNWAASARRRGLFVTTRRDERSFDLVLLVDAFVRVGPAGRDSLDQSVRGAAGLAQAHLRHGERVGVVALGGVLRGLAPGAGPRRLYRIADAVLDVRLDDSYVDPDVGRLPRTVLPPGALTVMFSPLLDSRARLTALELRRHGHPLVVVDVLCDQPHVGPRGEVERLGLRLWRLDRAADRFELGRWGVPVIGWDGSAPLSAALRELSGRPVAGRWRYGA